MVKEVGAEMNTYKILTYSGSDPAISAYRSMIYSDFMKSLRFGNEWYKLIESRAYFKVYRALIDQLLDRQDAIVKLAVFSDDNDNCLGWSISEGKSLHYCFVKKDQRRQGIGANLMPKTIEVVTHLTTLGQIIRKKKLPHTVFNPF